MRLLIGVLLVLLVGTAQLPAQVIQRPPQQQRERPDPADTIPVPPFRFHPPVSPMGALGRSMLLPGWGQAVLGRRGAGTYFVFWEGLTLTMTVKALNQLRYQKGIESLPEDSLDNKRAEVEDWLVLLVFNHLLAGAEAFISAHLWDFPADLAMRDLPGGSVGVGMRIGVGRRRPDPIRRTLVAPAHQH